MTLTKILKLKKPDYADPADISVVNGNMDVIDKKVEDINSNIESINREIEGISTGLENINAGSEGGEINQNKALPDSAEKAKGKLFDILSWFANMIKSITGKANWWQKPAMNIEEITTQLNNKVSGHNLSEATTIFVSKSGNDTTANGTVAKPFLTIQAAIDFAALLFGNRAAYISIGNGTYTESLFLTGFGYLNIGGTSSDASQVIITPPSGNVGIYILGCDYIETSNVKVKAQSGAEAIAVRGSKAHINNFIIDGSGVSIGVHCYYTSAANVRACQIDNCTVAIQAQSGSVISSISNSGSGNSTVFGVNTSILMRQGTAPAGTTLESKSGGGQIFS